MYGTGGSFRHVARNLKSSSPGRRWGRRGAKNGPPERLIDADLVPSTTRHSRMLDSRRRAAQALTPLWVLLAVAGVMAAFFIAGS